MPDILLVVDILLGPTSLGLYPQQVAYTPTLYINTIYM